jgi:hypothetical protein
MTRHAFGTRVVSSLIAILAIGLGGRLAAQEPGTEGTEPDPAELAKQIRRNMQKIEEDLSQAGTHDATRGEQVRKDLEKLVEGMKQRQDQVIKDIDDIVKQFKSCSGGSGSRDSNENQKQSRARDRNQSQQQKPKPRDGNKDEQQTGKQKPKNGQKPQKKGGGAEDNRPKPLDEGQNTPGDPRDEMRPEKVAHVNLNEIWGNLPPELRQKLVDRNFDDFTPEYKEQISEYFKKTSGAPK